MKNKLLMTTTLSLLFSGSVLIAQESSSELKLSLTEAQEYALQHNKMVISAKLDVAASKQSLWETISAGLIQVTTSAGFTDNIKQVVFLVPDFFSGHPENKIAMPMGAQYNSSISVQASMLFFNAPYLIGIETVKLAKKLSETNVKNTELDIREAVTSAYYLILVSEESLKILDANLSNLQETLKSTRKMYSVGMAESTDVDQMVSNVTMVQNSRSSLERTIELNYNLLRFQLGVAARTKITLSETLDIFTRNINIEALLSQEFNYSNNLNYKLIEGQEQLSALNLKSQKALVLPSLAGVYSNTKSWMGEKLSSLPSFNSSLIGLQLSVPVVASGQRYAKIKKARINLEKVRTTKAMVTDQLLLQEKQLRYNLVNANLQYKSQRDNVDVSKRVYNSMENKFKQGMASSLDLTQANSLYLQAQNNYISSIMNLLQTKLALDKLLNNMLINW